MIDLSKESLARVKKGGVVFHHSKALHTSGENRSDRWRRGYATHWVSPGVVAENETLDNAYFKHAGTLGWLGRSLQARRSRRPGRAGARPDGVDLQALLRRGG